jgi:hypothetical protein
MQAESVFIRTVCCPHGGMADHNGLICRFKQFFVYFAETCCYHEVVATQADCLAARSALI